MLIADAIDAIITLGWWFLAWLAVFGAVASVVLLTGTAVGAWAVRGLWRHVVRPSWARGRVRARILTRTRARRPSGRTEPQAYREAA